MQDKSHSTLIKIAICFFLSGMAALLYQTAWMRQLSVVFGTSELAVATVLTAYMSGLSLGAALAAKYINKVSRPLMTYGVLEGGIAISAVLVPYLLIFGGKLAAITLGGQDGPPEASGVGQLLFYYITTLIVLILPTALMGATLPLLSKYVVETDEQVGSRIGGLYAINTFGAVAGTLFAAFVLLPNISLTHTIMVGAAMNLLVLVVVMNVVKNVNESNGEQQDIEESELSQQEPFWKTSYGLILPIMTFSGIATFTYEVLWTRLISHILGGSVPAFAIMLAGFLTGIAAGSSIATKFAKTQVQAQRWFIFSQVGIAAFSAMTYYAINASVPEQGGLLSNSLLALSILLPSTLFIGATFPLAVRMVAGNEHEAAPASARVYAWNTVGAIIGATFAGYYLIPTIKYIGAIQFAVYLNLLLACVTALLGLKADIRLLFRVAPFALLVLVAVLYRPEWPEKIVKFSLLGNGAESVDNVSFYDVGRSSTVLLVDTGDYYRLRNNGLPESVIQAKGVPAISSSGPHLLSALPVMAYPEAKNMLVAGFGGGVVVENIPPSIEHVDVLELEPKVIEANKKISDQRFYDPFKDSRVNIIVNDARSALQLTDKKYDIIVSQPSHPWTAGASHLYTQEYMQLVEDHLTQDGVFLQWMNIGFTDEFLFRSLAGTLTEVFEHVRIYQFSPGTLYFLASNSELEIEKNILKTGKPFVDYPDYYAKMGIASAESLLAALAMENEDVLEFAKFGRSITDDFNTLGTRSALIIDKKNIVSYERMVKFILEYSPLFDFNSWVYKDAGLAINYIHLLDRLSKLNTPELVNQYYTSVAKAKPNYFKALKARNLFYSSLPKEAEKQFLEALQAMPENQQFKYELLVFLSENNLDIKAGETAHHYDTLGETPRAILDNYKNLDIIHSDYKNIKNIDVLLAASKPEDPWYYLSLKMRSFWKAMAALDNNDKVIAKEAMLEISKLSVLSNDEWSHQLRTISSYVLGDEDALSYSSGLLLSSLETKLARYQSPVNMINKKDKQETLDVLALLKEMFQKQTPIGAETKASITSRVEQLYANYDSLQAAID